MRLMRQVIKLRRAPFLGRPPAPDQFGDTRRALVGPANLGIGGGCSRPTARQSYVVHHRSEPSALGNAISQSSFSHPALPSQWLHPFQVLSSISPVLGSLHQPHTSRDSNTPRQDAQMYSSFSVRTTV